MVARNFKDLTGNVYGHVEVLRHFCNKDSKVHLWECRCTCGNVLIKSSSKVKNLKSCGCMSSVTHGDYGSIEYKTWARIKRRCYNKNDKDYYNYGERGIVVCDRWLGREGYANFLEDMGRRPADKNSLDRIDSSKNYCLSNCRWSDALEQGGNTSRVVRLVFQGKNTTMKELSLLSGKSYRTCSEWLRRNKDKENWEELFKNYCIDKGVFCQS